MAAAVLIPPSPHNTFSGMAATTRRQPLMSIPNATNSPHRNLNVNLTNSGSKRSRAVANVSQQENEPPLKRQAIEKASREAAPVTPRRHEQQDPTGGQVFERGHAEPQNNPFQKRLVAARDRVAGTRTTRSHNTGAKDVDSIRQWQKHYRKIFPQFRFYFDSVPADVKKLLWKQAATLGAQEETFFSKSVTHIVTGRQIPTEDAVLKALDNAEGTINPSVLEIKPNGRSTVRRDALNANDVLVRGMQMNMKVWPAEKLQKILSALQESHHNHESGSRINKAARIHDDLTQVLRNEKIAAAAERDQAGIPKDLAAFRGPFIYVHDMDERYKPTMVREYPKVARRQDGEWPQFRSANPGKCPFVEDVAMRKEMERDRAQQKVQQIQHQRQAQKSISQPKFVTASQMTVEPSKMEPPRRTSPRKVLRDVPNNVAAAPPKMDDKTIMPAVPERQSSFPPMPAQPTAESIGFVKPSAMLVREPSASGIQRSTMTSAIQSQMISSAAATGLKATTSKEVNELKRKVLERTHTGSLSIGSISSSHQVNALAGALKTARAPTHRAAKSRAQEKLGGIQEEVDPYADDIAAEQAAHMVIKKRRPAAKREPKPGYCENCHDKYDDFEDHIISRKHRKFATTTSNWIELDTLLEKLQAPSY